MTTPDIAIDPAALAAVDSAFADVADWLDATRPAVTVHTADRASPLSPWFLAWAEWDGRMALLVCQHVGAACHWAEWDYTSPAARLATLGQLPELLARVMQAVAVQARLASLGRVGEAVAEVGRALAIAKGEGA